MYECKVKPFSQEDYEGFRKETDELHERKDTDNVSLFSGNSAFTVCTRAELR